MSASYLARRAAQKQRVRLLYRKALKDTLNWAVHRHLFYEDADLLRNKFEANRSMEDPDAIDHMIANAEATYNKFRHPDPYTVPWAPGGSKFHRNPTPPAGVSLFFSSVDYKSSVFLSVCSFPHLLGPQNSHTHTHTHTYIYIYIHTHTHAACNA
ncbi:hypothetical protein V2J09_016794 [Rumex salicifolius]